MDLRQTAQALAAAAALLLVACSSGQVPADTVPVTGVTTVEVRDNKFVERVISVPAGTEVTWKWVGRLAHNVVGNDYKSEVLQEGEFRHRYTAPGQYDYVCTLHAGMTGRVVVTP